MYAMPSAIWCTKTTNHFPLYITPSEAEHWSSAFAWLHTPCFTDSLSSPKIFWEFETPVKNSTTEYVNGWLWCGDLVQACVQAIIRTWAPKSISLGSCIFLPGGLFKKSNKLPNSQEQRMQIWLVCEKKSKPSRKFMANKVQMDTCYTFRCMNM